MSATGRDRVKSGLTDLVAKKDARIFQDPKNFTVAMTTGIPDAIVEIQALAAGLVEKVPWMLRKDDGLPPSSAEISGLTIRLRSVHHLAEDLPEWVIQVWAEVLGVTLPPLQPPPGIIRSVPPPDRASPLGIEFRLDSFGNIRVLDIWVGAVPNISTASATRVKKSEKPTAVPFPGQTRKAVKPAAIPKQPLSGQPSLGASQTPVRPANRLERAVPHRSPGIPAPRPPVSPTAPAPLGKKPTLSKQLGPSVPAAAPAPVATPAPAPAPMPTDPAGMVRAGRQALEDGRLTGSFAMPFHLFGKAAAAGYPEGQFELGMMHLRGRGTAENTAEGLRWLLAAAKQGNADAQTQLGSMYQCGYGVDLDVVEARRWFTLAARQGHREAQQCLEALGNL